MAAFMGYKAARWGISPNPALAPSFRIQCRAQLGDKVLPLLRNPVDFLFLGPRVAIGALLNTNQNLELLPADIERLTTLVADPRPLEEKQNDLLLEVEDRLVTFLERGLVAENEAIATVSDVIPEDLKSVLPEELRKAILTPRPIPSEEAATSEWGTAASAESDAKPLATWTITSMDEDDKQFGGRSTASSTGMATGDKEAPASATTVAASQAAAELVEIQAAVFAVRESLSALQTNPDASREGMLKLNLREAVQSLSRRLEQCGPATSSSSDNGVGSAVEEAQALLTEVQAIINS